MKLIFSSLFLFLFSFSSQGSNLNYIKQANTQLQGQLIAMGGQVIKAIYSGGDLSKIKVFGLIASEPEKKKGFLEKLGKIDLTLALKKSNANEVQKAERREYLAKILAIIWKIHDLGEKQGVKGSSISYKLIDNGEKLYKFLKGYIDLEKSQSGSFAYDRDPKKKLSSHYKEESPESQFGIDMRFYANQGSLKLLPHNKMHLLFGKLIFAGSTHPNLLFVKFEEYGIGASSEKIAHGLNYFKSLVRSNASLVGKRIERVILPSIAQVYLEILNKVPTNISSKLFLTTPKSIKAMIDGLEALAKEKTTFQGDKESFMIALKKQYPADGEYIKWRTGNEVIISLP